MSDSALPKLDTTLVGNLHNPHGWNPFEALLGAAGLSSPWWMQLLHQFDAVVAGVAFYGGGFLVTIQLWRYAKHKINNIRARRMLK